MPFFAVFKREARKIQNKRDDKFLNKARYDNFCDCLVAVALHLKKARVCFTALPPQKLSAKPMNL